MNPKKIIRKILRGDLDFKPSSAKAVRIAIAESLVIFFEKLNTLQENPPEKKEVKENESS